MSTVATLVVALQGNIRGFTRALDIAEARLARFGTGAGAGAIAGIGVAAVASAGVVAAMSAKMAIDFESSMAGVRKTVDATDAQFAVLTQQIRDMAKEVPIGVNEIAKVAEISGQLGVGVEDIQQFTRVMLELGVSTNLTAEQAATGLARLSAIMQTPLSEARELGDTIVTLGNNFATTEQEILGFSLRIGQLGPALGLTERDVLGISAGLTALGVPAELGGTAIQRFFIETAQAIDEGGERLDLFAKVAGTSMEEFSTAFAEKPADAMLQLIRGLSQAEKRGVSTLQVLEGLGFKNQRQIRVLLAMAGGYDVLADAIRTANDETKTAGDLAEEANRRFETSAGKIGIAMNNVKNAMISFGQSLVPGIVFVLDRIGEWFEQNGPAMRESWALAEPFVKAFAIALGLAFEGLLAFLGLLAQMRILVPLLIAGLVALAVVLAPISGTVAIVIGVGLAIAALIGIFVRFESQIKGIISGVVAFIDEHWKALAVILLFITGPIGIVGLLIVKFRDRIRDAFDFVLNIAKDLRDGWRGIMADIAGVTESVVNGIIEALEGLANGIIGFFNAVKGLGPGIPGFDVGDIPEVKFGFRADFSGFITQMNATQAAIRNAGSSLAADMEFMENAIMNAATFAGEAGSTIDDELLPGLNAFEFEASNAAAAMTDLERAIKRFNEQRLADEIEAFIRGGPAAVLALRKTNAALDAEFLRTVDAAQKFGLDMSFIHREMFDRIKKETEQNAFSLGSLLTTLLLNRVRQDTAGAFGGVGTGVFSNNTSTVGTQINGNVIMLNDRAGLEEVGADGVGEALSATRESLAGS